MKIGGVNPEELKQLRHELEWRQQRKTRAKAAPRQASEKQRQVSGMSSNKKRALKGMYDEITKSIDHSTYIMPKEKRDETNTKQALKKGKNNNAGIHGIISHSTRKDVLKRGKQLVKYCVKNYDGVKHLRDIKPDMVDEFLRGLVDSGRISPRTIQTYISQLKKVAECNVNYGIEDHELLVNKHREHLKNENPYGKETKTRNRHNDGSTMTPREARIIAKKAGEHGNGGPLARAAVNTMLLSGVRASELLKLKWTDFDFENNAIDLTRKNMTKGDRPRVVLDVDPKLMAEIKALWDTGAFKQKNERIWGAHFGSQDTLRDFVNECAAAGKVAQLGLHGLRSAAVKRMDTQLNSQEEKARKQGREAFQQFREKMADQIMKHVSVDSRLNPMVEKQQKRMIQETDKDGNPLYYKNGAPIMRVVKEHKTNENGVVNKKATPVYDTVIDPATGKPVMEPKYTKEKLLNRQTNYLKHGVLPTKRGKHTLSQFPDEKKPISLL